MRYTIVTPRGVLTVVKQSNQYTDWLVEHPVKEKSNIELLADFLPPILCDVSTVNREAEAFGERGIVRGAIPGFPLFGQPGCWQDAACLKGIVIQANSSTTVESTRTTASGGSFIL